LFGAGRTRGVISRRSKTDHYRSLLCSLLFGGGRELFPRGYRFLKILIEESR